MFPSPDGEAVVDGSATGAIRGLRSDPSINDEAGSGIKLIGLTGRVKGVKCIKKGRCRDLTRMGQSGSRRYGIAGIAIRHGGLDDGDRTIRIIYYPLSQVDDPTRPSRRWAMCIRSLA